MARIAQSIEVNVPAHVAYGQLTQFEAYPEFMQDVTEVMQVDETRLHWSAHLQGRDVEWDAEITEQVPERCIAWHSVSGPKNTGRVELQEVDSETARVTLTVECTPGDAIAMLDADLETALKRHAEQDLACFKSLVESAASPAGTHRNDSQPSAPQKDAPMQSAASLSQSSDDEGVFSVAEEQSFDQQSDQARRVGHMPEDAGDLPGVQNPAEAMGQSIRQETQPPKQGGGT